MTVVASLVVGAAMAAVARAVQNLPVSHMSALLQAHSCRAIQWLRSLWGIACGGDPRGHRGMPTRCDNRVTESPSSRLVRYQYYSVALPTRCDNRVTESPRLPCAIVESLSRRAEMRGTFAVFQAFLAMAV
jgi:hypothetical protein